MLFSAKSVEGFPMFSPLNIRVEEWFRRLKKALWRLPGNEREKLHQELRQHRRVRVDEGRFGVNP